jgi:hypothetical protein
VGAAGEVEGHIVVESALEGCLLVETSRAPAGADSLGTWHFDPQAEVWRATRLDAEGRSYRLEGTVRGTELAVQGTAVEANGDTFAIRGTRSLDGTSVRQSWEVSVDGGSSWNELWRGAYVPAGTQVTRATPAPPAERQPPATPPVPPVPEPEPTRSGQVAARSLEPPPPAAPAPAEPVAGVVAELTPRDRGARRDPIRMTSPMQLQFPIGPVEKLSEGYGWTSTDTGAYQVDDVRLEAVEVSRRVRRNQVELQVTLRLAGVGMFANTAATVELLDGAGAPIDDVDLGRFPLGNSLTEQSQYGFIAKKVTFSLARDRFDQLFAEGGERPQLRVTLTTGGS